MSDAVQPTKSLAEKFSFAQGIVTALVALATAALSVGMFQGGLVYRVSSAEEAAAKNERAIERERADRERGLDQKLDVKVYEADKQILLDLKKLVEDIRKDQVEDLKERAAARSHR